MLNSYLQLELPWQNIWHAGHLKIMASFKSVAYVYNRCRSKYSVGLGLALLLLVGLCVTSIFLQVVLDGNQCSIYRRENKS